MGRFTLDIDTGGTMTDGLVANGSHLEAVKVETTPHDFTVCFADCIQEAARQMGFAEPSAFLEEVVALRWSSTISTNVLAERKGPKLGLIGGPDLDERLYGEEKSPAIGYILEPWGVASIPTPPQPEPLLIHVRQLLTQGVRRVVVSFRKAHENPTWEVQAKAWITERYPDHYLGSVPVLAGSDMLLHPDDQTRTHAALINAYVHTPLAMNLFKAEDMLIEWGYHRPLYIGHVNGGVARVAKTKAFDTIESGPVFGLWASAHFARLYDHPLVLSLDVGGTTAKLGLVKDGQPALTASSVFFGITLKIPWFLLRSLPLGGGSVARVDDGKLRIGPESMGAYPGPACYGLGGEAATVTDALLLAGFLNPERFLGGRRILDAEAAAQAITAQVAHPLGLGLEESVALVLSEAVGLIQTVAAEIAEQKAILYAFGGNGGLLGPLLAQRLGLNKVLAFRLGHVFSALGAALSDVRHAREYWPEWDLADPSTPEKLRRLIREASGSLKRELAGERPPGEVFLWAEVLTQEGKEVRSHKVEDLERGSDRLPRRGKVIKVTLWGGFTTPKLELAPQVATAGDDPSPAEERACLWPGLGRMSTKVYRWEELPPNTQILGPAVLEGEANTLLVPPGWYARSDGYLNVHLERG